MKNYTHWFLLVLVVLIIGVPFSVKGQNAVIHIKSPKANRSGPNLDNYPLSKRKNLKRNTIRWGSYQYSSSKNLDFVKDGYYNIPEWAILERELLKESSEACKVFFKEYYTNDGFLKVNMRWGADDGPDDAIENINRWPQLYALGGSDFIADMIKKVYNGFVRQMSQPKTNVLGVPVHLPYIKNGMYYKDFTTRADFMHISEGTSMFNMMGLVNPYNHNYRNRVKRFAHFYMGKYPGAKNYDPAHKVMRSMYTGSRGPLMRRTTSLDWAGEVSEVRNRYAAGHGEDSYEAMLFHFMEYYQTLGDNPLNLISTNLAYNAYALTGKKKYRNWILQYVDKWYNAMEKNHWIIPSDIGMDGKIGGATGKWYGGAYGWSFTVPKQNPPGSGLSNRERTRWGIIGFINAYMLTGNQKYLDAWRKENKIIYDAGKKINGVYETPRMYGNPLWFIQGYTDDAGWYGYEPYSPYHEGMGLIYFMAMQTKDRHYLKSDRWLKYLKGSNPGYAIKAMKADLMAVKKRMNLLKNDTTTVDERLFDDPTMNINPASIVSLIRLMGGGFYEPGESRLSPTFFTRIRYFDPEKRRPGIPKNVAALVTGMSEQSVTVKLVNLSPVKVHEVIIQAGAYAQDQVTTVVQTQTNKKVKINASSFSILMEPGSQTTLKIEMKRFVNQPTMDFPWRRGSGK